MNGVTHHDGIRMSLMPNSQWYFFDKFGLIQKFAVCLETACNVLQAKVVAQRPLHGSMADKRKRRLLHNVEFNV